jgi:hypothetical protein
MRSSSSPGKVPTGATAPVHPFVGREVELTLIRSVVERAVERSRAISSR